MPPSTATIPNSCQHPLQGKYIDDANESSDTSRCSFTSSSINSHNHHGCAADTNMIAVHTQYHSKKNAPFSFSTRMKPNHGHCSETLPASSCMKRTKARIRVVALSRHWMPRKLQSDYLWWPLQPASLTIREICSSSTRMPSDHGHKTETLSASSSRQVH